MDQELVRFREAATRENRGRRGIRRRHSTALQQEAVSYWVTRRRAGDGLKEVATALGVAPWSLRRWADRSEPRARFQRVDVVPADPTKAVRGVVLVMSADGPRVEGLTIDDAARLLVALR